MFKISNIHNYRKYFYLKYFVVTVATFRNCVACFVRYIEQTARPRIFFFNVLKL